MDFFDSLKADLSEGWNNTVNDARSAVTSRVSDAVAQLKEPRKGNLTSNEVASGVLGLPPGATTVAGVDLAKYLPMVLIAGVAYFIFSGKKGKG